MSIDEDIAAFRAFDAEARAHDRAGKEAKKSRAEAAARLVDAGLTLTQIARFIGTRRQYVEYMLKQHYAQKSKQEPGRGGGQ